MIYTNFLFFIIALALVALAPEESSRAFSIGFMVSANIVTSLLFWQAVRHHFLRLKSILDRGDISIGEARRNHNRLVNISMTGALILFSLNILSFELKFLLKSVPYLGQLDIFVHGAGLLIFVSYLVIVWYYAWDAMGEVMNMGRSHKAYILGNLKFNLAIVVPWLSYFIAIEVIKYAAPPLYTAIRSSDLAQMLSLLLFLIILLILTPTLITKLWDCRPLNDPEITHMIETFAKSQRVKFKGILSWDALNRSLVTAGVMGLIYPFRYLLLTPELLRLLGKEETMGVVCHEVGHVKKRHLLYYLLIIIGIMVFMTLAVQLLDTLPFYLLPPAMITQGFRNFYYIFTSIAVLVLLFRFVFGYFMRNFERQADIFCFECGINPDWLINSFRILGTHLGDDGKKKNWHHYNIPQRMEFLERCKENPQEIVNHNRNVKKGLGLFAAALIAVVGLSFWSPLYDLPGLEEKRNLVIESRIMDEIDQHPNDPTLYALLGELSYRMKKWRQARGAYEKSLELNHMQPGILNNLAWLYLTCPEERQRDHKRALLLAQAAEKLEPTPEVLDTLAEAYYQNSMFAKALDASRRALQVATENVEHFEAQYKKMKKHFLLSKETMKI